MKETGASRGDHTMFSGLFLALSWWIVLLSNRANWLQVFLHCPVKNGCWRTSWNLVRIHQQSITMKSSSLLRQLCVMYLCFCSIVPCPVAELLWCLKGPMLLNLQTQEKHWGPIKLLSTWSACRSWAFILKHCTSVCLTGVGRAPCSQFYHYQAQKPHIDRLIKKYELRVWGITSGAVPQDLHTDQAELHMSGQSQFV